MPLFENEQMSSAPGELYRYSGSNFVLLGRIIEQVTSMDYYTYISQHTFNKAGMKNTLAIPTDSVVVNRASGYTSFWGKESFFSRNDNYLSKASPAGGHYSTAKDLFLFSKSIRHGNLIKKETFELMTKPKVKGFNTHVGYGIDIDKRYDETVIGHSGGWFGVRTELMEFAASKYSIVVLSNKDDDGKSGASLVIEDLKKIIAGKKRIIKSQN